MTDTRQLAKLADEANVLEDAIVALQVQLRDKQNRLKSIYEHEIPELMEDLEMDEITTKSGLKVAVVDQVSAKKLTEKHAAALKWLRDNGQAGLIKTGTFVPTNDEAMADELIEQLSGEGMLAVKKLEVHHSSLAAAIRQLLAEGKEVPMDLLGGYQRRVAKIER